MDTKIAIAANGRLSLAEEREYEECQEGIRCCIDSLKRSFWQLGEYLERIKANRLFRLHYDSFEDYCEKEWGISRQRAFQLTESAEVVRNLRTSTIVDVLPETESQVRPLTSLPSPSLQQEAWAEANRRAEGSGKPVTAAVVQEVATEIKEQQKTVEDFSMSAPEPEPLQLELVPSKPAIPALPMLAERGLYLPSPEEVDAIRASSNLTFNKQDSDNIEWARWSWNPVTGCLHNCPYCYARDIANRFFPQKFAPTFLPDRLACPKNTKVPHLTDDASDIDRIGWRNVFVCSMADLWGKWMPAEIIRYVLREVTEQDQWTYLFLTKFPWRYEEFASELPANTWVGTTVDNQAAVSRAEKSFQKLVNAGHQGVRWLSVEPLMEPLTFTRLDMFDWVVIGGSSRSTQTPEFIPHFDWVADLYRQARESGCRVYMKTNLGVTGNMRVREYPEVKEVSW